MAHQRILIPMKIQNILYTLLFAFLIGGLQAQNSVSLPNASDKLPFLSAHDQSEQTKIPDVTKPDKKSDNRLEWWQNARFGMFIHWGLYAVPAGEWNGKTGYGEWIRSSAEIPLEVYDQLRPRFNPVKFDADAWVKMAFEAGMKYIVITSKHHDGFCMFDTKYTDFNIMTTPFKRDPMKELAAACKKYGLKFCFYHSIMDWHHPDYLPRREWEKERTTAGADFNRYVAYMKAQLKELLTNYGDIGVLWFDGEWENTWNEKYGKEIYNFVRALQPGILVNNRVGAGRLDMEGLTREGAFGGDFGTPEQQIPPTGLPGVAWETCMTMNDHWGYNKADKNFKTAKELIRMLTDIASKGGNYLLNVGPTAEGLIPDESVQLLKAIGAWMKINSQSVYGTQASPFRQTPWGRCTQKLSATGTILYLHMFNWPTNGVLKLDGVLNTPEKAYLLADPERNGLKITRLNDALLLSLPTTPPDTINSVIALFLRGKLDQADPPLFATEYDTFVDSLIIPLKSDRDQVEIRYIFGSSDPDNQAALYKEPFRITKTTTLSARCFRGTTPVSGTITKEFRKVLPKPALSKYLNNQEQSRLKQGITFRYFEGSWDSLPDLPKLKTVKQGVIDDFQYSQRLQEDNFCFEFSGLLLIPANSVYTFFTSSDDGSQLWIDDQPVVNNDGLHGFQERQGSIALQQGFHHIRVGYFDRTGGDNLLIMIKNQTMSKQVLPKSWLFYSP